MVCAPTSAAEQFSSVSEIIEAEFADTTPDNDDFAHPSTITTRVRAHRHPGLSTRNQSRQHSRPRVSGYDHALGATRISASYR